MKSIKKVVLLALVAICFPIGGMAQTYEQLWKEVEALQQKDLPQSVITEVNKIYRKAQAEHCLPQLMKAHLVRSESRIRLTPDSLAAERAALMQWTGQEQDTVARAVLHSLLGGYALETDSKDVAEALRYFRLSLSDKELLGRTSARDFRPMTLTGKLSETYFNDNLYDLLVRHAIGKLSTQAHWTDEVEAKSACLDLFQELIDYYHTHANRQAAFLTEEAKLWYQVERMGHLRRYALQPEEVEQRWKQLAATYAGLPTGADAYTKLAAWYFGQDNRAKVVETANEGRAKYPKGEWAEKLDRYARMATRPQLSAEIPFVYPRYTTDVRVNFANLKGVTFEFYRLEVSPLSADLRGNLKDTELIKRYGKKTASATYALVPRKDYQDADTVLRVQLPPAGVYMLKLIPQGHAAKASYRTVYVSSLQCIGLPVNERQHEFIAVDKLTGQPVPGAQLSVYRYVGSDMQLQRTHRMDSCGSVVLDKPDDWRYLFYTIHTSSDNFQPVNSWQSTAYFSQIDGRKWRKQAALFTDRALYRPGQTVHVSGFIFQQCGDSTSVVPQDRQELKLYTSSADIAKQEVVTDDFGVLAGNFVLPSSLRPGTYYVSCAHATVPIRVEEYKRPTFDVVFDDYTEAYNLGDSVRLSAEAKTFAGAPVRLATVRYRVVRKALTWFRLGGGQETELATGELQTDAEGKFVLPARLVPPEQADWGLDGLRYYTYTCTADVTDGAGETQSSSISLPVGRQSIGLQVKGLADVVLKEDTLRIQLQALNLKGQPVKQTIGYEVMGLDKDGKATGVVLSVKAMAQQSFVPKDILSLASGRYRLALSATDEQGRACRAHQDFVLFSKEDTRMPYETTAWFYQSKGEFDGQTPVDLYVGSSEPDVYLMVDVYNATGRIETRRLQLSDEVKRLRFAYRKEYGDGITVSMAFLRKGDLFVNAAQVVRMKPDKQLQLKWATFRDKLLPGTREQWQLHITDKAGRPVKANLMAALYDASLDKLVPHRWNFSLWFNRYAPYVGTSSLSEGQRCHLSTYFDYIRVDEGISVVDGDYSRLFEPDSWSRYSLRGPAVFRTAAGITPVMAQVDNAVEMKYAAPMADTGGFRKVGGSEAVEESIRFDSEMVVESKKEAGPVVPLRENFAETAFFYPQLRTDSLGNVSVTFTVPDALTEWKFLGLAHTQGMDYGQLTAETKTSKQLMVQPNLPRFVRRGDKAEIAASLVNLSMQSLRGKAYLEMTDPVSGKTLYRTSRPFAVAEGETGVVRFAYSVPSGHDVLVCKVWADAGEYSDGEQRYLPVLTQQQWMTETVPFQLHGNGQQTIGLESLFNRQSKTATGHRLTIEMTANPDWYAVQALPVVGNPTAEDALSWATAYYANTLASTIVEAHPRIREVMDTWKLQGGSKETLLSQLEKNQELKNLLIDESPWLLEAKDETEQKQRIALLFDLNTMGDRRQTAISKLALLQLPDGSWSWYKGMTGSPLVTTQIVEMLARLQVMHVSLDAAVQSMYQKAFGYLKAQADDTYRWMKKEKQQAGAVLYPDNPIVRYLYICALDKTAAQWADKQVNRYFLSLLENRSAHYSIYEKALIATIMQGAGKQEEAVTLVRSIKEYSVSTPEMGRYFDTPKAEYTWNSYKIPTQVAAMEAVLRIAPDTDWLDEMKLWLLKQKQVQVWATPIATADAVYAFLCMDGNRLSVDGKMKATVGQNILETPDDALGYVKHTYTGTAAQCTNVHVSKTGDGVGWGAVYAQYFEDMDNVSSFRGNGVSIAREYYVGDKEVSRKTVLRIGDKVKVRLTVSADRDMDFIQIKDERAACMEPEEQLSGYRWGNGLDYYCISRDASTQFFIDKMRKGTYTLEYTVTIDRSGTYQAGTATIQSAYAPEYAGHTEGMRWEVEAN